MSHPYDASTKYLVQSRLADWLPLCGHRTTARVELVDADLATVTAAADRVLCVHEDPSWLFHLELQSSRDTALVRSLKVYNVLLERQYNLLVRTVVVLLRRSADFPELTGLAERTFPGELPYLTFRYQLVRVWQLSPEVFLNGGLGLVSLAPLSAVKKQQLPDIVSRIEERITNEASPEEAGALWTATDVLMGLRYSRELVSQLLQGIHGMKESVTYQAIIEEGKIEGKIEGMIEARHEILLGLGRKRFGPPSPANQEALQAINDVDRLDRLVERLLDASNWEELLATP
jgi:predicted transposase YdaD